MPTARTTVNRAVRRHPDRPLPTDLITVATAAGRVGVHPESLYRLIRAGEFPPAVHIGHQIRVSVPRLERYLHGDAESA